MTPLTLLIVEDEVLIALELKIELEMAGYRVLELAGSADEAVDLAIKNRPEVVLMDIRLIGEMDGIDAARLICANYSPILIFTTGYDDIGIREKAMILKPRAFLIKPVDSRTIDDAIRSMNADGK